jgi:hypothetical protein
VDHTKKKTPIIMNDNRFREAAEIFAVPYALTLVDEYHGTPQYICAKDGFLAGCEYAAPKWIDVKERLPEEGQTVLLVQQKFGTRSPEIYTGEYENGKWTIYHWEGVTKDADNNPDYFWTTHWQPLPSPPSTK